MDTYNAGEGAMLRQAHLIVVVGALLIGCAVLASYSHKAAAAEEDRCEGTRTISRLGAYYLTNDLPGCPNKGGLLSAQLPQTGRNKVPIPKYGLLRGQKGDDEIRGSNPTGDEIYGGDGNDVMYGFSGGDWIVGDNGDDVIHGGDGSDYFLSGSKGDDVIYGGDGNDEVLDDQGEDVLYGGDGNDHLDAELPNDGGRDKLYCGAGRDTYEADPNAYVDSSCEMKEPTTASAPPARISGHDVITASASASPVPIPSSGGPAILLPAAALLLGSGILTYAILRRM
jgi:hypothetical protein